MWIWLELKIVWMICLYSTVLFCDFFTDHNSITQVARGFTRGAFELKPFTEEKADKNQHQVAISMLRTAEARTSKSGKKLTLVPVKRAKVDRK